MGCSSPTDVAAQPGTMALVPRVVDAVTVPVIAAGGIADGRGVAAAFVLGASAVQIGTAYLLCPEALTSPVHRRALAGGSIDDTVLTNVFTGRPARGRRNRLIDELGPMSSDAPAFPTAGAAVAPLRAAAEATGSGDFSPLWSGQAGVMRSDVPAGELTRELMADARQALAQLLLAHNEIIRLRVSPRNRRQRRREPGRRRRGRRRLAPRVTARSDSSRRW